jgi:hypothetical protein
MVADIISWTAREASPGHRTAVLRRPGWGGSSRKSGEERTNFGFAEAFKDHADWMRRASRISTGERPAGRGVQRLEWDRSWVPRCAGRLMSAVPITNRRPAYNCPGRIDQTNAVGFLARVTRRDLTCARLRGCDRLVFARQDAGFPLDRNASPQPIDCEQRGLLPLTIAEAS